VVLAVADDVVQVLSTVDGQAGRVSPNATPEQRAAWDAHVDQWLARLETVDGDALFGRPEWVIHGVMHEGLQANRGLRICRDTAMAVRDGCYEARLRAYTTLPLTADEVTRTADSLRRSLDDELRVVTGRTLGTTDVNEARRRFRSQRRFMSGSREELTRMTEEALAIARARMSEWFLEVPPDSIVIVPEPPEREATAGAPARYERARDGNAARLVVNLYRPEERPRMSAWVTAVHEADPGHHHQIALGAGRRPSHGVLRYFQMSGFIEGWGLYSERLADEMGIYPSDLERAWYLAHLSDAAIGMGIDPVINTGRWTRAQAVDTMVLVSGRPRWEAENYATRHLTTPGQIVTYGVGYLTLMRLREDARRRLGDRFDIREFHERVLEDGEITLAMLTGKIERWIERVRGSGTG
jgi:uncharacterized protein (DUF885 family)